MSKVSRSRHLFLILLFALNAGRAQSVPAGDEEFADRFARLLIYDSDSLTSLVNPTELALSSRLGIQYDGVKHKFLIGFDFEEETTRLLCGGSIKYLTSVEDLSDGFTRVLVNVPVRGTSRSFYFDPKKQLVSPACFYARHWRRSESAHFSFWISDSSLFHPEAIAQLESFLKRMAGLLQYSHDDMERLEKEKIIYVLCRDEDEIEQLTGYKSRGMYMLAYDYVTTTYSCHFHELVHLLVNYKLRRLPLFVHPLLQEGLAVAFGGRGGIAPQSLQQSGAFLSETGSLGYRELLSTTTFKSFDPSLTYPLSGLYVRFLVERLRMEEFLNLYKKYSGNGALVSALAIDSADLPREAEWLMFMERVGRENPIQLSADQKDLERILADPTVEIWEAGRYYHVSMTRMVALKPRVVGTQYVSKRFLEICPGRKYVGERFLLVADTNEVTIYDLCTNNSIAGYSSGLSIRQEKVRHRDGKFDFWVLKNVFAARLDTMVVVRYED